MDCDNLFHSLAVVLSHKLKVRAALRRIPYRNFNNIRICNAQADFRFKKLVDKRSEAFKVEHRRVIVNRNRAVCRHGFDNAVDVESLQHIAQTCDTGIDGRRNLVAEFHSQTCVAKR